VCVWNGRWCYNAQGALRLAEFTKVDVGGGHENQGNRPTVYLSCYLLGRTLYLPLFCNKIPKF
jgi:hypothetical protein